MEYKYRKMWLTLGWVGIALIFALSLLPISPEVPGVPLSDKLHHALAYLIIMLWFAQLYRNTSTRWLCCLGFIAMGVWIEFLQRMTGYRSFDYYDMLADAVGTLIGLGLAYTMLGKSLVWFESKIRS